MVRVTAAEEAELDPPSADVQVGRLREGPIGRIDDDLREIGRDLGVLGGDPGPARLRGPGHERHAILVPPDRCRSEDVVAKSVVEVTVRVDDDRDRRSGQLAQVVHDLARLRHGWTACR